ncbi:MAG TPA: hypothetical protein VFZ91_03360 [Allosphingosinicella sp.]
MLRPLAAAVCLLLLPASASGQARQWPIEEMAADLAYGFCPLFLAGQFALTAPELAERGFGPQVTKQPHPRVGEMSLVSARREDGEIAFGGTPGKACTVVVSGPKREAVLAKLRGSMAYMGLDFHPAANPGPAIAGLKVDTFKAPVDSQMLYVQLVETERPMATVAAQLFAMDN